MEYLNAFLCGGLLCAVGQIILDKTSLTPARILTGYVWWQVCCCRLWVCISISWTGAAPGPPCR